jgi:putative glycosyltransferase (TIGR04372 family)
LRLSKILPRGDIHDFNISGQPVNFQLLRFTQPHIHFTEDEARLGREILEQLEIPSDAKWVCLHNRDGAYLDSTQKWRDWSYHSFRDFSIESMEACTKELTDRGYYVLRMGALTEHGMRSNNPRIIDYANHSLRSELGDLYLLGNCHFYFGSDSGIFSVAAIFKRPFAFVNYPTIESIYKSYYWNPTPFILKRAWHTEKERFLSVREVFEAGLANASYTRLYEENGVVLVDNTPGEICDLAIEVDERLKGQWVSKPEDEELQRRFWDIVHEYAPEQHNEAIEARIGTAFLNEHSHLLN